MTAGEHTFRDGVILRRLSPHWKGLRSTPNYSLLFHLPPSLPYPTPSPSIHPASMFHHKTECDTFSRALPTPPPFSNPNCHAATVDAKKSWCRGWWKVWVWTNGSGGKGEDGGRGQGRRGELGSELEGSRKGKGGERAKVILWKEQGKKPLYQSLQEFIPQRSLAPPTRRQRQMTFSPFDQTLLVPCLQSEREREKADGRRVEGWGGGKVGGGFPPRLLVL